MKKITPDSTHVWLVMMKAFHAISRYGMADIQASGLGASDFQVLEVLLHKGPMPVNVLGPKVNLTPGAISMAVDRLFAKGWVSRVESCEDRRVRMVALTCDGAKLIAGVFGEHAATMRKVFEELSAEELQVFEAMLRRVGRRAEALQNGES